MKAKRFITIVAAVSAIIIAAFYFKDALIKISLEKGVKAISGLPLKIANIKVGVIKTFVEIKGLVLFNPPGYPDPIMLDVPKIYVNYDLPAIMSGRTRLKDLMIDLKEFYIIRNRGGQVNLNLFKAVRKERKSKKTERQRSEKVFELQIDTLRFKIGRVIYKDYSMGIEPYVREFNLDIDERYEDIKDPYSLVKLMVIRALSDPRTAGLVRIDINSLRDNISDTLYNTKKMANGAAMQIEGKLIRPGQAGTETAKEARDELKKALNGLLGHNKLPFGKSD